MTSISNNNDDTDYKKLYEQTQIEKEELEKRLKKYTSPDRKKKYYQNNKDKLNKQSKEYMQQTNYYKTISQEKLKEYNRRAYLKKKQKKLDNEKLAE